MWELASAAVYDAEKVEEYLREGYEPFAVSEDRGARIWFKRQMMYALPSPEELEELAKKEEKDEVHSTKPRKPKRGASSGIATPAKEEAGS